MKKLLFLPLLLTLMGCPPDKDDDLIIIPMEEIVLGRVETGAPFSTSAKFYADYKYGTHDRQELDFIIPEDPIGTAILFHGGAYVRYDRDTIYNSIYTILVKNLLDNNVAVVNANYRYLGEEGLSNPMEDGSSVIQLVKDNPSVFPGGIVLGGVSAGAGISLHNGLRSHSDVDGIVAIDMQYSNNVHRWDDVFPGQLIVSQVLNIPQFKMLYDELYAGTNPVDWDYLKFLTSDDPDVYLLNTTDRDFNLFDIDNLYHHANHAALFARDATAAGVNIVTAPITADEFIINKLNER